MARIASRYFDEKLEGGEEGVVRDMVQIGNEITSEITLYDLLGVELPESQPGFYEIVNRSQEYVLYSARYPWNALIARLNGRKKIFRRDLIYFDNIIFQLINKRRNNPGPGNNILTALVQCKDEKGKPAYSDKQIRDDFITLLGGGSENSSACFSWTIYLLWKNPEKLHRLRAEIDSLLPLEQVPDENIIQKLDYAGKVLKESLRLYPPGYAIIREAREDDIIDGEVIPKGSTIYIAVNVLHRHKEYWTDPCEFRPERFDAYDDGTAVKHAYIPFGAGQHACIGMHFAMTELKTLLAMLVRRYDFCLDREEPLRVISAMTPQPANGMPFRFVKRRV
jgi:cytochrome P450